MGPPASSAEGGRTCRALFWQDLCCLLDKKDLWTAELGTRLEAASGIEPL